MAKARLIQSTFNNGEWSPKLEGRVDIEGYGSACLEMTNFLPTVHGPAVSSPGTRFIAEAKGDCRLRPFRYSDEQAYVMELGNLYMRLFTEQGQVVSGGLPYEVVTPWTIAQVPGLQMCQSSDVIWATHAYVPVNKIERINNAQWTVTEMDVKDGPYLAENTDQSTYLRASAMTGTGVTMYAETRYDMDTVGTFTDTADVPAAGLTILLPFVGFQFTTGTMACDINTVKITIAAAAAIATDTRAKLYSNVAGSPGALLATSDDQDISTTGDKTYTFTTSYTMAASTVYWIVIETDTPDAGVTLATVAANASYGSGVALTAATITNSMANDWKCEVTYYKHAPKSLFYSTHVGALWRLRHSGVSQTTAIDAKDDVSDPVKLKGRFIVDLNPRSSSSTTWSGHVVLQKSYNKQVWYDTASFFYSTKQEFFETATGVWYRLIAKAVQTGACDVTITQAEHWGVVKVTAYTSASQVTVEVLSPLASTQPTPFWREGAWSPRNGYPRAVALHGQRLFFAGSRKQPYTLWGSWVGDYECFVPDGGTDDSAIDFELVDLKDNILWLQSAKDLVIGTHGEEAILSTPTDKPLSQTNIDAKVHTSHGTALYSQPVKIGNVLVFLQAARRKLRELVYGFQSDRYESADLTLKAEHITTGGIREIAYQAEPACHLWAIRNDGVAAVMAYYRDEKVMGWATRTTDGYFRSACSIPATYAASYGQDEVWFMVEREVNGVTTRYIEMLESNEGLTAIEDFNCVDSGLRYSGVPVSTVSGLDHLEGKEVWGLADGLVVGPFTVASGGVTLDEPASEISLGLPYACTVKAMKIEIPGASGTIQSLVKQLSAVTFRFLNTLGGKVGPSVDELQDLSNWFADLQVPNEQAALASGDYEIRPWPGDSDTSGIICFVQELPLPMTVRAIITEVDISEA